MGRGVIHGFIHVCHGGHRSKGSPLLQKLIFSVANNCLWPSPLFFSTLFRILNVFCILHRIGIYSLDSVFLYFTQYSNYPKPLSHCQSVRGTKFNPIPANPFNHPIIIIIIIILLRFEPETVPEILIFTILGCARGSLKVSWNMCVLVCVFGVLTTLTSPKSKPPTPLQVCLPCTFTNQRFVYHKKNEKRATEWVQVFPFCCCYARIAPNFTIAICRYISVRKC